MVCELSQWLGQVVRRIRGSQSLTMEDVGRLAAERGRSMNYATLAKLELGQREWRLGHLDAVSSAVGIEPDALLRMARVLRDGGAGKLSENGSHAAERSATG